MDERTTLTDKEILSTGTSADHREEVADSDTVDDTDTTDTDADDTDADDADADDA